MNNEHVDEQDEVISVADNAVSTADTGSADEDASRAGTSEQVLTPGEILRERREQRGLSVQQVADELHLTMHFVRALEADAYDKLPGDVFARGYMRCYSSLLQLDADQMLSAFNAYVGARESKQQAARHRRAVRRRRDRNRPWIIFSGIAFVAVAVVLWFVNSGEEAPVPADNAVAPAAQRLSPLSSPVGTAVPAQPAQPIQEF